MSDKTHELENRINVLEQQVDSITCFLESIKDIGNQKCINSLLEVYKLKKKQEKKPSRVKADIRKVGD